MPTPNDSDFKLHYLLPDHEIDSQTLIDSLIGMTTVIQEVNRQLETGKEINVNVKALGGGSFIVHLDLIETITDAVKNIFSNEHLKVAKDIISTVSGAFALRKYLKKKNPVKITANSGSLIIENEEGQKTVIAKEVFDIVVNNEVIQHGLDKTVDALVANEKLTGFEITDKNDVPFFEINKEELQQIATQPPVVKEQDGRQVVLQRTGVYVVKPSFDKRLKWEVIFQGNRIAALVKDAEFLEKIENNEIAFGNGHELDCELQITKEFSKQFNTYINKEYVILKVYRNLPPSRQMFLTAN